MKRFSEKVFLQLKMPTEEVPLSDEKRIRLALEALGYENVQIPLAVIRRLYPFCRNTSEITLTLQRWYLKTKAGTCEVIVCSALSQTGEEKRNKPIKLRVRRKFHVEPVTFSAFIQ